MCNYLLDKALLLKETKGPHENSFVFAQTLSRDAVIGKNDKTVVLT